MQRLISWGLLLILLSVLPATIISAREYPSTGPTVAVAYYPERGERYEHWRHHRRHHRRRYRNRYYRDRDYRYYRDRDYRYYR